jgi:hypothetical protein
MTMRLKKTLAAAMALLATVPAVATPAHAVDEDALIAGAIGFGVGTLFGGAISQPRYYAPQQYYAPQPHYYGAAPPVYYQPMPAYVQPAPVYVQPAMGYGYRPEPWSQEWYAYCENRYRSFDPSTGYFLGYDGEYHFC